MKEYYFDNKIYYRTNEFKADRKTLVFVHGVSGSCSAWWPFEKILENKYNILTYDIRGHGLSKKYPNYEDYEIKNFTKDLHDLVTFLKIQKFILISNSFAGLVHLEYLKLYGEMLIANVFTSPEIDLEKSLMGKITRPILKVLTGVISFFPWSPKPRGHVDYSKYPNSTDWDIKRNLADMRNTGLLAHFYTLRQSFTPNQKYDLEKITIPTLIIHGEKDTMVPIKNARAMSEKIKNSRFMGIKNIDHNTAHNAVKEMSEAIDNFVKNL